uniref:Uncharacterized protein n=1 Tax=Stegastes partitus TaxID=144197 RepID=A0A3B4YUN4_9TELE
MPLLSLYTSTMRLRAAPSVLDIISTHELQNFHKRWCHNHQPPSAGQICHSNQINQTKITTQPKQKKILLDNILFSIISIVTVTFRQVLKSKTHTKFFTFSYDSTAGARRRGKLRGSEVEVPGPWVFSRTALSHPASGHQRIAELFSTNACQQKKQTIQISQQFNNLLLS